MVVFNGTAKIRVIEARNLRPTEWSKRFTYASDAMNATAVGASSTSAGSLTSGGGASTSASASLSGGSVGQATSGGGALAASTSTGAGSGGGGSSSGSGGEDSPILDTYVNVDCDEYHIGQTVTRPKTCTPVWNEDYQAEVHNGKVLGFTVFHDCALPPDDFVANCRITFDDLKVGAANDIWVDLEPHGQLHLLIELQGTATEGSNMGGDQLGASITFNILM